MGVEFIPEAIDLSTSTFNDAVPDGRIRLGQWILGVNPGMTVNLSAAIKETHRKVGQRADFRPTAHTDPILPAAQGSNADKVAVHYARSNGSFC